MEVKVLRGAEKTIRSFKPVLFVENNTVECSAEIINTVTDLGYTAWWQISGYYNPDNFFGKTENIFERFQPEANLLCFPNDVDVSLTGGEKVTGPEDDWRQAARRMLARRDVQSG
jgi:hypothetical protein